jgi:hypothetical protein
MPDPMYERFETEGGGVVEIFDTAPGLTPWDQGVMLRLSVNDTHDRRTAEIYLDPKSQQDVALALLANMKE